MSKPARGLEYVKALLEDEDFQASIKLFRDSENDFACANSASMVLQTYRIPSRYGPVISHYIETSIFDESLIDEPVKVIRTGERGVGVALQLSHDITQPELRAYINDNWSKLIVPVLDSFASDRRGRLPASTIERDRMIYDAYLNKKHTGYQNKAIAFQFDVSERTVSRVIAESKRDKKKT